MTIPRANAELAQIYFSDNEMLCWKWDIYDRIWKFDENPSFHESYIYHVGKTRPTEPPQEMCEIEGVKFPAPIKEMPKKNTTYYIPCLHDDDLYFSYTWEDGKFDKNLFNKGIVHLSKDNAIKHCKALIIATHKAIKPLYVYE